MHQKYRFITVRKPRIGFWSRNVGIRSCTLAIQSCGFRLRRTLICEGTYSYSKYTEDDIINMLEFLVHNIFVVFGGKVFQQIVGIPMGTTYVHLLADISVYSYEA